MMSKKFHIGDVLSITTEYLLSPRLIDGVYDILNYMTEDNLFTHQLVRAASVCKPELLKQFPQLKDVEVPKLDKDDYTAWVEQTAKNCGMAMELDVKPLAKGAYEHKNAVAELREMIPEDKPIIIVSP